MSCAESDGGLELDPVEKGEESIIKEINLSSQIKQGAPAKPTVRPIPTIMA